MLNYEFNGGKNKVWKCFSYLSYIAHAEFKKDSCEQIAVMKTGCQYVSNTQLHILNYNQKTELNEM